MKHGNFKAVLYEQANSSRHHFRAEQKQKQTNKALTKENEMKPSREMDINFASVATKVVSAVISVCNGRWHRPLVSQKMGISASALFSIVLIFCHYCCQNFLCLHPIHTPPHLLPTPTGCAPAAGALQGQIKSLLFSSSELHQHSSP